MQQFQDDIMRVRQLAQDVDKKLSTRIIQLEQDIRILEDRIRKLEEIQAGK